MDRLRLLVERIFDTPAAREKAYEVLKHVEQAKTLPRYAWITHNYVLRKLRALGIIVKKGRLWFIDEEKVSSLLS